MDATTCALQRERPFDLIDLRSKLPHTVDVSTLHRILELKVEHRELLGLCVTVCRLRRRRVWRELRSGCLARLLYARDKVGHDPLLLEHRGDRVHAGPHCDGGSGAVAHPLPKFAFRSTRYAATLGSSFAELLAEAAS